MAMTKFLSCSIAFLLCFVLASADEEAATPEHVLNLDHSNFSETVKKHDFILVEFYAPWCGHCKNLAPEYVKAATILKDHIPLIVLAKVDASNETNKALATEYGVNGFPTLKILRNGGTDVREYKGPREADGIVEFLKKQVGPASIEIKSIEDAGNLISGKKVSVVGVFSEFSGEEYENFTALADNLRADYDFGHTLDAKLLPHADTALKVPAVRLFKPFDELFVDSQDFHVDALENFLEEASLPVVTFFSKDPSSHPYVIKFFNNNNAKALLFVNVTSEKFESFKSKYQTIAEEYKGKGISFLLGDLDASQGAFQYFGLKEDDAPLIFMQNDDDEKFLKTKIEPDDIASWVKDFKEGHLTPFKKSEPIPEVNNEPVKVVVGDSIQEFVFNSGKNVLLEFYAPWCGHCKKLAPTLEEVAVYFENDTDVVIAKIDATANDFPSTFEVTGYPTMYFYSSKGKLVMYDGPGERTKESIIEFIDKNKDEALLIEKAVQVEEELPPKDEL